MTIADWFAGGALVVSVAGGFLSWLLAKSVALAAIEERVAYLRDGDQTLGADLKAAARELREVATEIKVMSAEQAVINKMSTVTLQDLSKKSGFHERLIAEHSATITLMRELIMLRRDKDGKPS